MALILVGGQAKNIGKTTLVCNIISAFRQFHWTAVKITAHLHQPEGCELLSQGLGWSVWEQHPIEARTDTGRFLSAGAERALLVRAEQEYLDEPCTMLEQQFSALNWIVESSSATTFLKPDLSLLIVDAARAEFKDSAQEQLASSDVLLLRGTDQEDRAREIRRSFREIPIFPLLETGLHEEIDLLVRKALASFRLSSS
ncbi:MAG: hypothetical protein ACJ71Q_18235 [Terriglobales bacterium]